MWGLQVGGSQGRKADSFWWWLHLACPLAHEDTSRWRCLLCRGCFRAEAAEAPGFRLTPSPLLFPLLSSHLSLDEAIALGAEGLGQNENILNILSCPWLLAQRSRSPRANEGTPEVGVGGDYTASHQKHQPRGQKVRSLSSTPDLRMGWQRGWSSSSVNSQWFNRAHPCNETFLRTPKWWVWELQGGGTEPLTHEICTNSRSWGPGRDWNLGNPVGRTQVSAIEWVPRDPGQMSWEWEEVREGVN